MSHGSKGDTNDGVKGRTIPGIVKEWSEGSGGKGPEWAKEVYIEGK